MNTTHKIEAGNGCDICWAWLNSSDNWNPDTKDKPKLDIQTHIINITESKGKSLEEIFADNIQISQLKEVIPPYEWKDERFEEERKYFLWWLTNSKRGSKLRFDDQISAWEEYKREHEFSELDDDELEFTPSWLEEIEEEIVRAMQPGNYNEYMGQQ